MNKEELLKAIEQKWMEDLINSLPTEPNEDLEEAARNVRDTLYLKEGKRDEYGNPYFLQDTLLEAVIAGANWQKEKIIKKACNWLDENRNCIVSL